MCWRSGVMTYLPWRVDELLMYRYRKTPYKEWLVKGKYEAWHHCRVSGLLEHVSGADGAQHNFFQFPRRVPVPRRSPPAFDDLQSSQPAASCVRRPRVVKDAVEVCSAASSHLNPPHRVFDDMFWRKVAVAAPIAADAKATSRVCFMASMLRSHQLSVWSSLNRGS